MMPLMEPVYCAYCGTPNYAPAPRCDSCGAPLNYGKNLQKLAEEVLADIMADEKVGIVEAVQRDCISVDDIESLRFQLPTEYRSGRCCYIIHPDPLAILCALKGSDGRYLIERGAFSDTAGNPVSLYMIDRYRLCFVAHPDLSVFRTAASRATGKTAMVFGNLEEYQRGNKDAAWKLAFM